MAVQTFKWGTCCATRRAEANELLAPIQDWMPVIIEKADWPVWLGEAEGDPAALLRPAPSDVLRVWQVDKRVCRDLPRIFTMS
jgi:putative SOS response-associated peptidase YedK